MKRTELLELIARGESLTVEFKSYPINGGLFARDAVAFANSRGGRVLIGVDDDGRVSGMRPEETTPKRHGDGRAPAQGSLEQRVSTVCREKICPVLFPRFEVVRDVEPGRDVAVVTIDRGWTVHHVQHQQQRLYCVRAGRTHREASPADLAERLPQQGAYRVELRPVSGTSLADLDRRRLVDYFGRVRDQEAPGDETSGAELGRLEAAWKTLLTNTLVLREEAPHSVNVAALVLFGKESTRFLPHARIQATAYDRVRAGSGVADRRTLHGAIVPLHGPDGSLVERGLVEQALEFVSQNAGVGPSRDGARLGGQDFPLEAVQEAIVNAIIHRNYEITAGIEINIYADRLEVVSPGGLADGNTVARMRAGCRRVRNELIRDVMRDYGYMDHVGMGVPRKIVWAMSEHNGTDPDLVPEEDRFTVRLWRQPARRAA